MTSPVSSSQSLVKSCQDVIVSAIETSNHAGNRPNVDRLLAVLTLTVFQDYEEAAIELDRPEFATLFGTTSQLAVLALIKDKMTDEMKKDYFLSSSIKAYKTSFATFANLAHQSEKLALEKIIIKARNLLLCSQISYEEWANPKEMDLPPYPKALTEFLEGKCDIWPDQIRKDTHIVVPLFPSIVNGSTIEPMTLHFLTRMEMVLDTFPFHFVARKVAEQLPVQCFARFSYGVLTKDVLPHTKNMRTSEQLLKIPDGYCIPTVFETVMALLWNRRLNNTRALSTNIFTRTSNSVEGSLVTVGDFRKEGLSLDIHSSARPVPEVGLAVWKSFELDPIE
jgi:hypothetical protein